MPTQILPFYTFPVLPVKIIFSHNPQNIATFKTEKLKKVKRETFFRLAPQSFGFVFDSGFE
jgi:hypothetical protein